MGKRMEKSLETRQKLIDAINKLSKIKKYSEMSIAEITNEAGVGKGTFYTYFKRREDVISVIAYEKLNFIKENLLNDNRDIVIQLSEFLMENIQIIESNSLGLTQQWYRSMTSPIDNDKIGINKINIDIEFVSKLLYNAIDKKTISPNVNVKMLSLQILSIFYGAVAFWCISNGEISQLDIVENFCINELPKIIETYRLNT